jgi:NitT/TauT family transport system substrate-binding protein
MKRLTRILVEVTLIISILWLAGCGQTQTAEQANTPPTKLKFQLSWLHSVAFVGAYVAQENGYYTAENLEVELLPGGLDDKNNFINPIEQVVSGQADFGIIDSTILLKARADGSPVVAIASIYQRHPLVFASLREKNITRLEDLLDANIQVSFNSMVIYQALLATKGIDPAKIRLTDRTDFTGAPLTTGGADVIDAWVITEVPELELAGHELNFILPSDYGVEVYPNVVFTTEEMIANRPEVVEKFVRATVRGLRSSVDDTDAAAKLTFDKYLQDRGLEVEQAAMQRAVPLISPTDSLPGLMRPEIWKLTHQILLDQGILSKPLDLETAYTLQFLEKVYPDQ